MINRQKTYHRSRKTGEKAKTSDVTQRPYGMGGRSVGQGAHLSTVLAIIIVAREVRHVVVVVAAAVVVVVVGMRVVACALVFKKLHVCK